MGEVNIHALNLPQLEALRKQLEEVCSKNDTRINILISRKTIIVEQILRTLTDSQLI